MHPLTKDLGPLTKAFHQLTTMLDWVVIAPGAKS